MYDARYDIIVLVDFYENIKLDNKGYILKFPLKCLFQLV